MKISDGKPSQANVIGDLPSKIIETLQRKNLDKDFVCAIKTSLKPGHSIPIIWAILTPTSLMLCNTNKHNGIWRIHSLSDIIEMRLANSGIQIIWNDMNMPDLYLPFPSETPKDWVELFFSKLNNFKVELIK